jgi:hypothetical protein
MFIEKNNNHGQIINLDHVASMNWDKGLSTEFIMANGQTITWSYDTVEDQVEDLDAVSRLLYDTDMLISVEMDQE